MTGSKKALSVELGFRKRMIDSSRKVFSVRKQCDLLEVCRAGLFYKQADETKLNQEVKNKIDETYTKCPFYGSRRMAVVNNLATCQHRNLPTDIIEEAFFFVCQIGVIHNYRHISPTSQAQLANATLAQKGCFVL